MTDDFDSLRLEMVLRKNSLGVQIFLLTCPWTFTTLAKGSLATCRHVRRLRHFGTAA